MEGSSGDAATSSSLRNQVLASICATYGGLANGLSVGYSSPAGPDLQRSQLQLDDPQVALIGSMMPLGALFGGLACGWCMERLGRRTTMLLVSVPNVLGWLLITYAASFGPIVAGRLLAGFATGCCTVVVPAYVGEVCEPRVRGTMGAGFQFQATLGVLIAYIIGKYVHWNSLAIACAIMVAVWAPLACLICETPVWLLEHGRDAQALEALQWLRGPDADVGAELKSLREQTEHGASNKATVMDLFSHDNRRPFVMGMMLMLLQQLSGVNAVIFYTVNIFEDAGSSIDSDLATIIVGLVQSVSTFAAVVLVDRLGRKVLLLLSDGVMAVCLLALGVYFYMESAGTADDLGWLPLVSLMLYIFAFSIGLGPIPWLMMSELFAPEVKGAAGGIATAFNWTLAFIVTLTFEPLVEGITEAGVFWLFAAICFGGVCYVTVFAYETKGKTLQEIQEHFRS
ncbi:Facilitated trehalose transporter Tret1 [Amphibalanus amphitrite]|uniref:Facilitated trehalose transporter Tret1 n=1 Tax=Amphibalanus amphitrite TaxID=1232801 RepID=A0A6A4WDR2_AMPAM|nr:facilitated trehalose transporter Tret1-like [Amphibalanus amphitrite]KAF0301002.1 Facilitated trehalose transporter Tret1 [Amphibalanus amphitrite]